IYLLEKEKTEDSTQINSYLAEVATLNALYEKTTLTETEKINFEQFKKLCQTISRNNKDGDRSSVLSTARDAEKTLQTLSSIQVEEGKNKLDEVLDMTYFTNLFSYLELVILIV